VNVAAQRDDAKSMLTLYRRLIALRRAQPALEVGRFQLVETQGEVLAYIRRSRRGESDFLIAMNLDARPVRMQLRATDRGATIALSTHLDRDGEPVGSRIELRGDEGLVVQLS